MKKLLAILLVLAVLVMGVTGCKPAEVGGDNNEDGSSGSFVKPDNYASVVLMTINPQFKMYLDADGNVLAVEAVNEGAKQVERNISLKNKKLDDVVKEIVTAIDDGGIVKGSWNVKFEVVEQKDKTVDVNALITKVENVAEKAFEEVEAEVTVNVTVNIAQSENSVNTNSADNTNSVEQHTHNFGEATCTKPATCECGATEGKELGHKYVDGKCTRCKTVDPDYKVNYTSLDQKGGKWAFTIIAGTECFDGSLVLSGEYAITANVGDDVETLRENVDESVWDKFLSDCKKIDGKYYYFGRGDGDDLASVTENGTTVTVTDTAGVKLVLNRTGENTMKVVSCSGDFTMIGKVAAGTEFTYKK